ncbi:hypothetical protein ACLK2A_16670 [Escherichia coli]
MRDGWGRQNCLWESVARGPALINNRGVSKGLQNGKAPPEEGGLTEGKGYDKLVIILIVLFSVNFAQLINSQSEGGGFLTLVPFFRLKKISVKKVSLTHIAWPKKPGIFCVSCR